MNRNSCMNQNPQMYNVRNCRISNPAMGRPVPESRCGMEECGENPQAPRTAMANECKMKNQIEDRDMQPELPTGSRSQLLNYINEVSFAAYDALLFLDTHSDDADALAYFRKHSRMRNAALKEYERLYGPLTLDTARDSIHDSFVWSQQPWPWEGGAC